MLDCMRTVIYTRCEHKLIIRCFVLRQSSAGLRLGDCLLGHQSYRTFTAALSLSFHLSLCVCLSACLSLSLSVAGSPVVSLIDSVADLDRDRRTERFAVQSLSVLLLLIHV